MGPPTSNHLFLNADNSKLISLVTIILNVDLLWCGRSRILCLCALHLLSATSFSTFNHQTPDVYLLFQMWIFLPVPIILRKANNLNNLLTCLSVTNQLSVSGRVTVLKQKKLIFYSQLQNSWFISWIWITHPQSCWHGKQGPSLPSSFSLV